MSDRVKELGGDNDWEDINEIEVVANEEDVFRESMRDPLEDFIFKNYVSPGSLEYIINQVIFPNGRIYELLKEREMV